MKATNQRFKLLPIALGIASMSVTAPTWSADAATAASPGFQIEEVVITARKTEESQQVVPVSVTAFSAKDLQKKVILSVADLGFSVTGLMTSIVPTGGTTAFSMRVSRNDFGQEGSIALYVDDVPLPSPIAATFQGMDVSSLEVLKGPQGTLFGANAVGGAVIFHPNKPTDKFEGYVGLGIGNFNRQTWEGMVNLPVNDVLQLRFAAEGVQRKGFEKDLSPTPNNPDALDSLDYQQYRFSARLKPNTSVTNDFMADYLKQRNIPAAQVDFLAGPASIAGLTNAGYNPNLYQSSKGLPYLTVRLGPIVPGVDYKLLENTDAWGVSDSLNIEMNDNLSVKNVLGYRWETYDHQGQSGALPVSQILDTEWFRRKQFTEEFTAHLTSDDKRTRAVAGLFYMDREAQTISLPQGFSTALFAGGAIPAFFPKNFSAFEQYTDHTTTIKSTSLFGQVDYDLTKELTATLGLRYNWDRGSFTDHLLASAGPLPTQNNPGSPPGTNNLPCNVGATARGQDSFDLASCVGRSRHEWKAPSYNFVLTDKFAEKSMVYFKASGGYLSGGFNQTFPQDVHLFKPEKNYTFEAGLKSDWELWGRPIRTNIDAFYGVNKNKQEVNNGIITAGPGTGNTFSGVFNAGSAEYYGTDLEVKFYPIDGLELGVDWTHIESQYLQFQFPGVANTTLANPQDLSGLPIAEVPRDTLSLSLTYDWPLASNLGKLSTTFKSFYRSQSNYHDVNGGACIGSPGPLTCVGTNSGSTPANTPAGVTVIYPNADVQEAFWISDFSTSWKGIMGSNFDTTLWVKNLFDKHYISYQNSGGYGFGGWSQYYGNPRTVGLNVRYNF